MKTNNPGKSITIYFCALASISAISSGVVGFAFLFVIIINIVGYVLVKNKYGKHPELSVLMSTNDTCLLYLCKLGGCYGIAFFLTVIIAGFAGDANADSFKSLLLVGTFLLFYLSPSVDDGVKRVQEKYRE